MTVWLAFALGDHASLPDCTALCSLPPLSQGAHMPQAGLRLLFVPRPAKCALPVLLPTTQWGTRRGRVAVYSSAARALPSGIRCPPGGCCKSARSLLTCAPICGCRCPFSNLYICKEVLRSVEKAGECGLEKRLSDSPGFWQPDTSSLLGICSH